MERKATPAFVIDDCSSIERFANGSSILCKLPAIDLALGHLETTDDDMRETDLKLALLAIQGMASTHLLVLRVLECLHWIIQCLWGKEEGVLLISQLCWHQGQKKGGCCS